MKQTDEQKYPQRMNLKVTVKWKLWNMAETGGSTLRLG